MLVVRSTLCEGAVCTAHCNRFFFVPSPMLTIFDDSAPAHCTALLNRFSPMLGFSLPIVSPNLIHIPSILCFIADARCGCVSIQYDCQWCVCQQFWVTEVMMESWVIAIISFSPSFGSETGSRQGTEVCRLVGLTSSAKMWVASKSGCLPLDVWQLRVLTTLLRCWSFLTASCTALASFRVYADAIASIQIRYCCMLFLAFRLSGGICRIQDMRWQKRHQDRHWQTARASINVKTAW